LSELEGFVRVGSLDDFQPGVLRSIDTQHAPVALVNAGGELHAISDFCPHEGVTLSAGYGIVQDGVVICMLHSSVFGLESGEVYGGPADFGLTKYEVRVVHRDVYVRRP
jgi:nitrite reductase/ring-hydroxylating ferredoxin subunit